MSRRPRCCRRSRLPRLVSLSRLLGYPADDEVGFEVWRRLRDNAMEGKTGARCGVSGLHRSRTGRLSWTTLMWAYANPSLGIRSR